MGLLIRLKRLPILIMKHYIFLFHDRFFYVATQLYSFEYSPYVDGF
jgi:hypothetical protein